VKHSGTYKTIGNTDARRMVVGLLIGISGGDFGRVAQTFNRMTRELERAEEQRRNLTADVAHELRTPLHIIQGNLEGLLDGVYQPTTEHINVILDETHWLARLIDDLRILSLAESGQLVLHKEVIAVDQLLAQVSTSFCGQAEAAGIQLFVARNEKNAGATLIADVGRLYQVLGNLVVNALRYTPSGGTITLRGERVPGSVRLIVRDTGKGIPPEDIPSIFDRFWRGDPSRSHTDGVSGGLGLAIARQLVQAHGGNIEAEARSKPTQKTTHMRQST
jgi:signal transduction histidine kinase